MTLAVGMETLQSGAGFCHCVGSVGQWTPAGAVPEMAGDISVVDRTSPVVLGSVEDEEEEKTLRECSEWVVAQGLSEGEFSYEVGDEETGECLAIFDLAWPNGLQEGLSQPVTLLLDEGPEIEDVANQAGYRFFTNVENFKEYVTREVLAETPV